jgi:hypothetical protein
MTATARRFIAADILFRKVLIPEILTVIPAPSVVSSIKIIIFAGQ